MDCSTIKIGLKYGIYQSLLFEHGQTVKLRRNYHCTEMLSVLHRIFYSHKGIGQGRKNQFTNSIGGHHRISKKTDNAITAILTYFDYSLIFGDQRGYRARIRNHGHSCFLCEIVIRSQFHTTYEPEA
jgi:hypothetical protein